MSLDRRIQLLELTHHNLDIVPGKHIEIDLQTDSLMHKNLFMSSQQSSGEAPEQNLSQILGFPYVMAVSQGRLAEAILSQAMIRKGHYIPGSALFPTTKAHQERNGGTAVEVMSGESLDLTSARSFKGNIDLEGLEEVIKTYGANKIPYICIEPCNNAVGGHPIAMENMRSLSEIARRYGIPIYLDACRLVDNAVMIQEREQGYENTPVKEIIKEFCSYADGCTMSATKDFPTTIGGFIATRDAQLFHRCLDYLILWGAGLNNQAQKMLANATADCDRTIALVRQRINLVKKLYLALGDNPYLVRPAGGHGIYLNISGESLAIPETSQPALAFLYQLFKDWGIRGSLNHNSAIHTANGINLVRFAVPILGIDENTIEKVAEAITNVLTARKKIKGLEIVSQGAGLTGFLRTKYRPLDGE